MAKQAARETPASLPSQRTGDKPLSKPGWNGTTFTDPESLQNAIANANMPDTVLDEGAIQAHYPPADPEPDDS